MRRPHRPAARPDNVTPDSSSTPADRVSWLLKAIWDDNRSAMARDVGCSHVVLSKIATGKQTPGGKLLKAIAAHPKVNPNWLLFGDGEPLLQESGQTPSEGWPLPIAAQLLPGPPGDHRSLLTGQTFPIAGAFYRPSRYWLEVGRAEAIVRERGQMVQEGDLLLMETEPSTWQSPMQTDGHICGIRIEGVLKLGLVKYYPENPDDGAHLTAADTFERLVDPRELVQRFLLTVHPGGKLEAERMPPGKLAKGPAGHRVERVPQIQLGTHPTVVTLSDIVCVCEMIVRRI